jgi:hypothetical protein
MQRNIKVGDRIYYEYLDGSIGSAVVISIRPEVGKDYYGNPILYNWLKTSEYEGIEDYNTIAPSNPKVKAYIKEMKAKREALINEALMFAYPDRKGFSKAERKACDRLLDFAYMKHKELEEYE